MSQMDSMNPMDPIPALNQIDFKNQIDTMNNIFKNSIHKSIKKSNLANLKKLAMNLKISMKNELDKNKVKHILIQEIQTKLNALSNQEILDNIKETNISFIEIRVKDLLSNNINIDTLINTGICLDLKVFFENNPSLKNKFNNTCDLIQKNTTVTSNNCQSIECQGLYILTIHKNETDYIVKFGAFAESQGMSKRIASFGGGNYETGSATNQWFQAFIKKAFGEGYTSKFTYYNHVQDKININDLDCQDKLVTPFVIRSLETQLFQKYYKSNNNIGPIFGSNCYKT